ncbi:MAG: hypothetical protein AVDCRST_MAG68-1215 [uncultured Gemmatimonadetes bacterium]|uniref:Uncharacterized protein n=1 Tax=uncultured Gemmatimonadota bacterium TaxID=203437 RepID=A0A6J4KQ55_9BACT|nr:MAG: hypothetical protein AVDCRST_MAG68-1215 [uncultured Gemmatimonadota bacterium]
MPYLIDTPDQATGSRSQRVEVLLCASVSLCEPILLTPYQRASYIRHRIRRARSHLCGGAAFSFIPPVCA